MTLPTQFRPTSLEDFIGSARRVGELLQRAVKDARAAGNAPIKILLNGEAGIGKSALAEFFIKLLGLGKWSVKKYSGTDLDIDQIRQIAADFHYKDIFGDYRLVCVEEADLIR